MALDFKKLAQDYQDNYLEDLKQLISVDSARDDAHKSADAPLGPGPKNALKMALDFAKRDGFTVKNVDNMAGHVEYGDGDEILGVFGHVDEVPAGEGWDTDPFKAVIKDGNIYGRGTSDDKGPALAAYYALKLLKDQGIKLSKKVRLIYGTDEESNWEGINRYLEVEPTPDFGFSPDASFPIINGEKGIASYKITFDTPNIPNKFTLVKFTGGTRVNMVPRSAKAAITYDGDLPDTFFGAFERFLADNDIKGSIERNDEWVEIEIIGKSAHAMDPKQGVNAGTYLAAFLNQFDFDQAGAAYIGFIADFLHLDFNGQSLHIDITDDVMGPLTMSPDLYSYDQNGEQSLVLNVRFPQGTSAKVIEDIITETVSVNNDDIKVAIEGHAQEAHYVSGDDPLVKTLLSVYHDVTGLPAYEASVGGGTYGRILKRGVAFGALFPNRPNVMHQANEYAVLDDLFLSIAIYAQGIYELAK